MFEAILVKLEPSLLRDQDAAGQQMTLQHWFQSERYLVVLDDLEVLDPEMELVDVLRRFINPTKFLLISRHDLAQEGRTFKLTELSQTMTLDFLRHLGNKQNIIALAQAEEILLEKIYQTVSFIGPKFKP